MVRGEIEQSIINCKKAVELEPGNSLSVALLGNVLIDSGRIEEGIRWLKRAIRLCPSPPAWYFSLLGAAYHFNGNNDTALYALELAIEHEPSNFSHRLWYCSALVESARLPEAKTVVKKVLEMEPDFSTKTWASRFKAKSHEKLKGNLLAAGFPE